MKINPFLCACVVLLSAVLSFSAEQQRMQPPQPNNLIDGLTCEDYDDAFNSHLSYASSWGGPTYEHSTGSHGYYATYNNTCAYYTEYGIGGGQSQCYTMASGAWNGVSAWENGALTDLNEHEGSYFFSAVDGNLNKTSTSCGYGAVSVTSCNYFDLFCNEATYTASSCVYPTINWHFGLAGFNVGSATIRTTKTCPSEVGVYGSPIAIDLDGGTFEGAFTAPVDGIFWDFYGRGSNRAVQIAWANPKRRIGWLWLDRNHDGIVNSAKELFGNMTWQPLNDDEEKSVAEDIAKATAENRDPKVFETNGFRALCVYDRKAEGGNEDGQLDASDSIWSSLRVFVGSPSNPSEIDTLSELGIKAISCSYTSTPRVDQYGNQLRFAGTIVPARPMAHVPIIYDVFLLQK